MKEMFPVMIKTFVRYTIVLLVGCLGQKYITAQRLYSGDTVTLWGGVWSFKLDDLIEFFTITALPTMLIMINAIWSRAQESYKLWFARLSGKSLTSEQVTEALKSASKMQVIKTVINQ